MIRKVLAAGIMLAAAGTGASADDRARLGDATLVLLSDTTACRLVQMTDTGDTVLRLPLSGLCLFHRDDAGALRLMDSDAGPIFLVEAAHRLPGDPPDCDTQVLAIRAGSAGLTAAPTPARVATCPPFQWDDAMFLGQF